MLRQVKKKLESKSDIKSKLEWMMEECSRLYEDYEESKERLKKEKILEEMMAYRKAFDEIVDELQDEDEYMRQITCLRLSFEKMQQEVVYFGGLQEMKKDMKHRMDHQKPHLHKNEEEEGDFDLIRKNEGWRKSEIEYERYREDMKEYEDKKKEYDLLDDYDKRKQIDVLLDELQKKTGYTIVNERFSVKTSVRDKEKEMRSFIQVQEEIKRIDKEIVKEKNEDKLKVLHQQQEQLKEVSTLMMGLSSIWNTIFSARNPVIRFFKNIFSSSKDKSAPSTPTLPTASLKASPSPSPAPSPVGGNGATGLSKPKDVVKEVGKEVVKQPSKEVPTDPVKGPVKGPSKEPSKDPPKDSSKASPKKDSASPSPKDSSSALPLPSKDKVLSKSSSPGGSPQAPSK